MSAADRDFAFEMAASAVRFGAGVTREVGADLAELGVTRALVITDPVLRRLAPVQTVIESLDANGIAFVLYDRVRIEPSEESFLDAMQAWASDSGDKIPEKPGWKTFARILYAGKFYE